MKLPARRMGNSRLDGAKNSMNRTRWVRRQRRMHAVGAHGERGGRGRAKISIDDQASCVGFTQTAGGRPTSPSGNGVPSAVREQTLCSRWILGGDWTATDEVACEANGQQ